tara:strand:- start:469 stop:705 length:237 start_codon:yes stop_codon:yes gene_type:complete
MFYSEATTIWGFIAHIPLAIVLLMFLSRQVALRDQGISLRKTIFDDNNQKVLNKYVVGGIFGLVLLGTLSPISRLMLQ